MLLNGYIDTSTDIWALGCIFTEMIERKVVFPGSSGLISFFFFFFYSNEIKFLFMKKLLEKEIFKSIVNLLGTPPLPVLQKVYKCPLLVRNLFIIPKK